MASESTALNNGIKKDVPYQAVVAGKRSSSLRSVGGRKDSSVIFLGMSFPSNIWATLFWGWMTVISSCGVVLVTKQLVDKAQFPKLALQVIQMIGQIALSGTLGLIFDNGSKDAKNVIWPRFWISPRVLWAVAPLSVAYVFRVYATNASVGKNDVSMYQTLRGASIVVTVLLSWPVLGIKPTIWVMLSCLLVVSGVGVPYVSNAFSTDGLMIAMFAALATAVFLVVIKYYLPAVNNDSRVMVNYNSVGSLLILVPWAIWAGEFAVANKFFPWYTPGPDEISPVGAPSKPMIWLLLLVSTIAAFAINITSMMLIRVSAPVSYDIFGAFKTVVLAVIGFCFKGDKVTSVKIAGIVLSIVGTFAYGKAKQSEHAAKVKADAEEKKRLSVAKRAQGA